VRGRAEEEVRGAIDILICADWNRYHPLWGGPKVLKQREIIKEGEQIVSFMHQKGLQSLLAVGTPTGEHTTLDQRSAIDLVLGSERVQDKLNLSHAHTRDRPWIRTQGDRYEDEVGTERQPAKEGGRGYTVTRNGTRSGRIPRTL
jgi:hypothetical protein